jgi:hypothetical protein
MTDFCGCPHPDTPPLPGSFPPADRDHNPRLAERAAYGPCGVIRCTRAAGHPDDHATYGFNITAPISWPNDMNEEEL